MLEQKYSNRLADEKSPYLLQHAHNPVDWYPWGDEAFQKARDEDKPIFLSIGYSTCHWCHVMERESFEDEEVAQALNKDYISIKVDREERPDIDHIYMTVCQALTGHGGWPLTILMTPEKKPFFAGTYYPKNDSMGIPGLLTLLARASDAWKNKRQALLESSEKISSIFDDTGSKSAMPSSDLAETAFSYYERSFDDKYGGFGSQPKFPTPHNLLFLLRYWHTSGNRNALLMAEKTLESMKAGGIYDHIGFGFSRYSTDNKWLVPHFEKMLYDNALLAIAYLEAYQASKKEIYSDTANEIFTYILRDMTSPEGGFYSAEDADSDGEEGKFYVWTPEEVIQILGSEDGQKFCSLYDITPKGNFEGKSIPNLIRSDISPRDRIWADQCRAKLFSSREKRVHPYKDDKILTGWNGLMIAALAIGGRVLGNENYTQAAEKAFRFISGKMMRDDGRLMARYRDGQTAYLAYADDYSFLIWGLIELYETTFKPEYLEKAVKLNDDLIRLFYDSRNGGLFIYGSDSEQLIARPKDSYDGALPSANSVSAYNLIKLSRLTGDHKLEEKAKDIMMAFGSELEHHPTGHSFIMSALLYLYSKAIEVVISGVNRTEDKAMLDILAESYRPFTLFVYYNPESDNLTEIAPFLSAYKTIDDKTTAYVCENYSCKPPVNDISTLREYLTFTH